jgi:hypothetical protein
MQYTILLNTLSSSLETHELKMLLVLSQYCETFGFVESLKTLFECVDLMDV